MIERYLDYIQYTKCLALNTVNRYKKGIMKFERYLQSIWKTLERSEEIKLIDVLEFIGSLRKAWLVEKSCNSFLDWVKGILRYEREILEMNVLHDRKIEYLKEPDKQIWFFKKEEKRRIINEVKRGVGKKELTQLRNRLLTYMLMQTWLRCHEIAKIKVEEIWENLQVIGKGQKLRTIYLRPELLEMIGEYLSKRKRESEYLFDSTTEWRHLREWSIRNIFIRMSRKLGFHIHAHKFRHTFATDLLHLRGSNIFNVSKLMGHSRITTTQIYLGVNDTELKNLQFRLKM